MVLKKYKPLTPSERHTILNVRKELSKKSPENRLTTYRHRSRGRNVYGRVTARHRGGGHKRRYRMIDFKRDKLDISAKVQSIEFDPNRSADIALLAYLDGEKRYILAPKGLGVGDSVVNAAQDTGEYRVGSSLPLALIPPSTWVHAVEMVPGKGAQLARSAGVGLQLMGVNRDMATLKMPSGEVRMISANCRATIGVVGNSDHKNQSLGKAGRRRKMGWRPRVRGAAKNPHDHPHGGGSESKGKGGRHLCSPQSLRNGTKTRKRNKNSNKYILFNRKGLRKG